MVDVHSFSQQRPLGDDRDTDGFTSQLEDRCRKILDRSIRRWRSEPLGSVERGLAHAMAQLTQIRSAHTSQKRSLLRHEIYVENAILNLYSHDRWYHAFRIEDTVKLKHRLSEIEKERRKLALVESDATRTAHEKLLTLLDQHAALKPPAPDGR